jgi:hypothetical protein
MSVEYHGWVGQTGAMITASAWSLVSFWIVLPRRLKGGNRKAK